MAGAFTLMVQGTTSDAGKTFLVAGLCRLLARRGLKVAPFKPQNMALNSAVTADGGEIGRAQALQAFAAGLAPRVDFNPVLLKPNTEVGAQVIVHGRARGDMSARDFHDYKRIALDAVLESHARLAREFELIVVEGAGSPAEINLRDRDIANMGFAERVDCPVVLIADIDRGGVFAHLVGTLALLSESERARIVGFVINRFRGDIELLRSGLDWLEAHTGKPVLGVLPYMQGLALDAEDAIGEVAAPAATLDAPRLRVRVPVCPRISNHTDFDALRRHAGVDFAFVGPGQRIDACDLVVLPGSKSVRADLSFMRAQGWDEALYAHLRYGGKVIGICGGLQMLGTYIDDPLGIEGDPGRAEGLGLLDLATTLEAEKQLRNVVGALSFANAEVRGYEIHCGRSTGPALGQPAVLLSRNAAGAREPQGALAPDGALSRDGRVLASYVHGLFDVPAACDALLTWAGARHALAAPDLEALRLQSLDRVAEVLARHLRIGDLFERAGIRVDSSGGWP